MSISTHHPADISRLVRVALGPRSYDIHIGAGLIDSAGTLMKPLLTRPKTVIVCDEVVAGLPLARLRAALVASGIETAEIILPPGEQSKDFATLERLCDDLLAAGIERNDLIIAFGGGVIGDLAGFAAAVLRRGVGFVQVPTTLLAQVDSSVGGKTAINSKRGKNLIGAFHQPATVICDSALLDTLPDRQLRAGYAEVVKYGLISDRDFFDWLETNRAALFAGDPAARRHAIAVSCEAKAAIVAADEREAGVRALLNLGHTFGHAFEAATQYDGRVLHGEAVALGMAMAFRLSTALGLCATTVPERVATHLKAAGLPAHIRDLANDWPDAGNLVKIMGQDKKVVAGRLTLVLARGIGDAFLTRDVAEADLL